MEQHGWMRRCEDCGTVYVAQLPSGRRLAPPPSLCDHARTRALTVDEARDYVARGHAVFNTRKEA